MQASRSEEMYFTIRKNGNGYFWWRAVSSGNNKILASSELMTSKQACRDAIAIVQSEAFVAPVYDKTTEVSVR
jgi:uncharacterized protein YegP (UPF0339 family)